MAEEKEQDEKPPKAENNAETEVEPEPNGEAELLSESKIQYKASEYQQYGLRLTKSYLWNGERISYLSISRILSTREDLTGYVDLNDTQLATPPTDNSYLWYFEVFHPSGKKI